MSTQTDALDMRVLSDSPTREEEYTLAAAVATYGRNGRAKDALDAYVKLGQYVGFEAADDMLLTLTKTPEAREALLRSIGVKVLPRD